MTVGREQKIVSIPGAAAVAPAAAAAGPVVKGRTGALGGLTGTGHWVVVAVIKGGPADKAGVRPGGIVVSMAGRKMKDIKPEELEGLDEGPVGSTLEGDILDPGGDMRKVTITRAVLPESGTMDVLQEDGTTVKQVSFDAKHPFLVAAQEAISGKKPAPATPPTTPPGVAFRSCTGFAVPCDQRNSFNCSLGGGCFSLGGQCTGTPLQTCFGKNQWNCASVQGCMWIGSACVGAPSCVGHANQWACSAVLGCSWSDQCSGVPTACPLLPEATCALQPGCFVQ